MKPELDGPAHGAQQAGEHEAEGNPLGHVRGVDGGEREAVVAQLAELFLAVPGQKLEIEFRENDSKYRSH